MRVNRTLLMAGAVLALAGHSAGTAGGRETGSRRVSRRFSNGFFVGTECYFLLEYRIFTPRRPVWFIMPIERPPKVHFHGVFLYRYDTDTQQLERLATVLESVPRQTFISYTIFGLRDRRVVFAFPSGRDSDSRSLTDLRVWDREAGTLVETERVHAPQDNPSYERYFGDYEGGLASYPGMITITKLRTEVLAGVSPDDWDFPRP